MEPRISPGGTPKPLRLDAHVHLIGDGVCGDDCRIFMGSFARRILARMLLSQAGLAMGVLKTGVDHPFRSRLVEWIRDSSLNGVVLLAMDWPYHEDGTPLRDKAAFFVPNETVLQMAAEALADVCFVPAVSIHPARADAMEELERCHAAGAGIVKLLPNVHNVDYSRPQYQPFWRRMAELRMILLSHTGGELALPVINARFAEPLTLRTPLECGVTVIAAHCGTRDLPWQHCGVGDWLSLCREFPHLYGDNSALATPHRAYALRRLLDSPYHDRIIHGSDFPVPCGPLGPFLNGLINANDFRSLRKIRNAFERDAEIKRRIGFDYNTFTRLSRLLAG